MIEQGTVGAVVTVYPNKNSGGAPYDVKVLNIENPVDRKHCIVNGCIQPTPLTETEKRQNVLEKRNVRRLVHFTRLENLQSILRRGIWTRQYLDEHAGFPYLINDTERFDGKSYCTSLSVSLPNYKMLAYLKQKNPNGRWVLLLINPQIICEEERYLFCSKGNAAAFYGSTLSSGAEALESIFEEPSNEQGVTRETLGLKDWEPTNPQAEVLLSRKIEAKDIQGIIFETRKDYYWFKAKYNDLLNNYYTEIDEDTESGNRWFEPRQDYKYWQRGDD